MAGFMPPGRLVGRTPFLVGMTQKSLPICILFVPDVSGLARVNAASSYAYEIYYVPNSSGSQSNGV
jgi:hypothetical protein